MGITNQMILTPELLLKKSKNIQAFLARNSAGGFAIYGSGRMALLQGLKLLGLSPGDNVVLPAYICDSATYPFRMLGIEMRFHRTLFNLEPDIADLEGLIDERTKAVLGVNYFGFPQRFDMLSDICRRRGCFFIEDNAHSFLSRKDSKLLGSFGDISFASLWKLLPIPNGGILFVNNEQLRSRDWPLVSPTNMSLKGGSVFFAEALLKYLEARLNFPKRQVGSIYRQAISGQRGRNNENSYLLMEAPLKISAAITSKVDFEKVIQKRRQNYNLWQEKLAGKKGLRNVFDELPDGVCPQFFPVIADNSDSFVIEMQRKVIPTSRWPHLPKEVKDNGQYPIANFLAEHLFRLPVHQDVNQQHLKRVIL